MPGIEDDLDSLTRDVIERKRKKLSLIQDVVRKDNALTDAQRGVYSVKAWLLQDLIYHKYTQTGEKHFSMPVAEIRKALKLSSGDYKNRIIKYFTELSLPFVLKDYKDKDNKDVAWATAYMLKAKQYKDGQNFVDITIDDDFISYLVGRSGYTNFNFGTLQKFRTKTGYAIFEIYRRYYTLPHQHKEIKNSEAGIIKKDIKELNGKFGTNYKHASEMMRAISRGIKEIQEVTDKYIHVYYDKPLKKFVFVWEREKKYPALRIPLKRVDELVMWFLQSNNETLKIKNIAKYKESLRQKVLADNFDDLDKYFRGMLQWKYELNADDYFDSKSGLYRDFKKQLVPSLF